MKILSNIYVKSNPTLIAYFESLILRIIISDSLRVPSHIILSAILLFRQNNEKKKLASWNINAGAWEAKEY